MNQKKFLGQLSEDELKATWKTFLSKRDNEHLEMLVRHYLPIVRYTSERFSGRLPKSVSVDELMSAGLLGLLDAVKKFDPTRGVKFESYCLQRIRGSILDELRNMDWLPRLLRQKLNHLDDAIAQLKKDFGRMPTDDEIRVRLKISKSDLEQLYRDSSASSLFQVNIKSEDDDTILGMEALEDRRTNSPSSEALGNDLLDLVQRNLSPKERYVFTLYYNDELTMREIGQVLRLSESRVSQIHARVVAKVRAILKQRLGQAVS